MANNRSKIDQIHDLLPKHFNSRQNTNWAALIDALGEQDQVTADLITEVRKQFFVKTAGRPYLDRLASNNKIARPKLVGMDDPSFRQYIPVLSYQPKQVKLIIDQLLDIFFFKESTTAFVTSTIPQPFNLNDGWELEFSVDESNIDRVSFNAVDFTDINNATADEIVATINRQTKHCYATAYYDNIAKNTFIRIFTNTIGSKGSLRILGGRSNTSFRFNGFISAAGNGADTQWAVTKIGDEVTFTSIGGANPNISEVQIGDLVVINILNNQGTFSISNINLANNSIVFKNLFATAGTFTNTSSDDVKFIRPQKFVAYLNPRRAMAWETSPGEITVEMPTSPPVVKRSLKGSIHLNGAVSQMTNRDTATSLSVADAFQFPEAGSFWLENVDQITERWKTSTENQIVDIKMNTRLQYPMIKYTYSSRTTLSTNGDIVAGNAQITNLASTVGLIEGQQILNDAFPPYTRVVSIVGSSVNTSFPATASATLSLVRFLGNQLTGISPDLPALSSLNEFSLSSLSRSSNVVTGVTSAPHGFEVDELVIISDVSGGPGNFNGVFKLTSVSGNTFTYYQVDIDGAASTFGTSRVERVGMSNTGSKVVLTTAISNEVSRITGAYLWDSTAAFTLSSNTAQALEAIQAGKIVRMLSVTPNTISSTGGSLIFDYGRATQEGPIRFLYKPTNDTIALDPSYTFKHKHAINSPIVEVRSKGPHQMSSIASEYSPYITDPSDARFILQDLIKQVKSAGIFVNFLIHYPDQLYSILDVYKSGVLPG